MSGSPQNVFTSNASHKYQVPGLPTFLSNLATKSGGSHNWLLLQESTIHQNSSLNSGKRFTYYCQLIIMDTNRARWRGTYGEVRKGPKHEDLHPVGEGVCHPPSMWVCSPSAKLSEPCHLRDFREVSLHKQDWLNHRPLVIYSISSPSLSTSQRLLGGAQSSKFPVKGCCPLTSPMQKLDRAHQELLLEQKMFLSLLPLRKFQVF